MIISIETIGSFFRDFGTPLSVIGTLIVFLFKRWLNTKHERKVLTTAILAEVESIETRYNFSTGNGFKPEYIFEIQKGQCLFTFMVEQDYFNAYTSNASKIGLLKVDDVSVLVDMYTSAKGFIDSINQWNQAVSDYKTLLVKFVEEGNPLLQTQFKEALAKLPYMYIGLLNEQAHIMAKIQLVKKLLRRYN